MTPLTHSVQAEPRTGWKWFLALGVLLIVLGLAGVSVATLMQWASLVFGPMLLASSFLQVIVVIGTKRWQDSLLHFAAAGLEAILGFFILADPIHGSGSLIVVAGILFLAIGAVRLARSLEQRRGRGWNILAGAVALILGICVGISWPVPELWFVGLCIGIDFLCHGVSWSGLALTEQKESGRKA
jgi:uncharacterized membrane protein HdeD (DUF308 family)